MLSLISFHVQFSHGSFFCKFPFVHFSWYMLVLMLLSLSIKYLAPCAFWKLEVLYYSCWYAGSKVWKCLYLFCWHETYIITCHPTAQKAWTILLKLFYMLAVAFIYLATMTGVWPQPKFSLTFIFSNEPVELKHFLA